MLGLFIFSLGLLHGVSAIRMGSDGFVATDGFESVDDGVDKDDFEESLKEEQELEPLELPNCSAGKLQLSCATYKVTKQVKINHECSISSDGAKLLLSAPLVFLKTAHFEGKVFVKGLELLQGPCFSFEEDAFVPTSAELSFAECHNAAEDEDAAKGGAIRVRGNLTVTGALSIVDCSTKHGHGGGIYVQNRFTHSGGTISINNSWAQFGGGIRVESFFNSGGDISISNSHTEEWAGGGILVISTFTHSRGSIAISDSSAGYGGGICVYHDFTQSGGNIEISNSSANKDGGGIYVEKDFTQSGGNIEISDSSARSFGGCVRGGNVVFANASATFSRCRAQLEGGGMKIIGNMSIMNASLMFDLATAGGRGAALLASHLEQTGGDVKVYNSFASGEVIGVTAWVMDGGAFHLHHCKADAFLVSASAGATLDANAFVVSEASAVGMLVSSGEVTLRNSFFKQTTSPQLRTLWICRAKVVEVTNCSVAGTEALISWELNGSTVNDVDCDDRFAGFNHSHGIGCQSCNPGFVFVKDMEKKTINNRNDWQGCVPCPDGTKKCNATAIEMLRGRMVAQNLSCGLHCPNPLACWGGSVSSNASSEMCAPGYEDLGCAKCAGGFARSDSNVFTCRKCAAAKGFGRFRDTFLFLGFNAVIFIISAAGVVNAHRRKKDSAVYLNQLMSFAAVTAPALLALKQTSVFERQLDRLPQVITVVSMPVQAGDGGESTPTVSTECLLSYMGLGPSLVLSHALSSLVYTVLTLGLAAKSGKLVALVVAINCFLPKFCAAFGKYLICYSTEEASKTRHCLVGENSFGMTIAVLAIMACFVVGPGSWMKMTRDKSLNDQPQVLFLTASYRKGFETWEVERLIRRMLLKTICTTLPITVSPFAQMAFFSLVLVAALFLHTRQAPYVKAEWNWIEQSLLLTALLIVILTTLCLGNESHWENTEETEIALILVITVMVAVAGGTQSFLLCRELVRERCPAPVDAPEPVQSTELTALETHRADGGVHSQRLPSHWNGM